MLQAFHSLRLSLRRSSPHRNTRLPPFIRTARNLQLASLPSNSTHNARPHKMVLDSLESSSGSFDLKQRIQLDYTDVTVSKWQSRETGLSIVHIDYDAPIVKGYFVVATEIFNDSGCPHTLEHLIFLGSEQYPYKGVLDNLANRAFAAGTNAWTDTDHTAYTIETAGEQGFLQLLPIYVDHILYPTLTGAGFVTEVHHVTTKAEDAGVVYSEMQGRENTSGDLAALLQQRLFYPKDSAYRSETGGLMEALRKLTIDEIREYHGSYYVPHNLCLIVAGKLSTKALLETVQAKVEPQILKHQTATGPRPEGWRRPFVETPSSKPITLEKSLSDALEFPEKDESMGELIISFVGPSYADYADRKFLMDQAIDVLGVYLTDSAVAPLTKEFVEIPSPLCTYVYFAEGTKASFTELAVYFGSVPVEHLDDLDIKFKEALQKIVKEGVDMDRIRLVLKRERLKLLNSLESSGGDYFSGTIISDFLYGKPDGSELGPSMAEISLYDTLGGWSSKQWTDLIAKYYVDNNAVVVRARPSSELAASLEEMEKSRVQAQREELGPVGLENAKKILEDAKAEHEKPIPSEVLTSFPVPDVKSISWIPVDSGRNDPAHRSSSPIASDVQKHIEADATTLPYFVQFDGVKSDFVTITAYLSTASVPTHLKPYLWLYLSSFFTLPLKRSSTGARLSHEDVIKQLDNDTVAYEINLGSGDYFQEIARVGIKVETPQYAAGIAWLRDLLLSAEFDVERLEVTIAKLQQSLPEMKRDGNTVLNSLYSRLILDDSSSGLATSLMSQIDFIPNLAAMVKADPKKLVKDMHELRKHLTDPSCLRIGVSGNVIGLKEPRSAWAKNFENFPHVDLSPVPWSSQYLSVLGRNPVKKGVVLSLPTIESSFAQHVSKSISGWDHPEVPALRLACEILDGTESFLWKYIRGAGLAYGANLSLDLENGLVSLSLYRCPNSYQAYAEASKVVRALADGSIKLEETDLDAAKSSLVYNIARSLGTPGRAASMSFVNQVLRGVGKDHSREELDLLQAVDLKNVQNAIRKHILPLFDSSTSVAVVVSAPSKVSEIKASLEAEGYEVESRALEVSADEMEGSEGDEDSSSGSDSDSSMGSR